MDIDILKAKRKSLRAAFTVCCNGISNRIETETLGNNEVNALYKQLQDKFSRLETTQGEISDLLSRSDELKNAYQEDFSKAEEYRDKFCQICSLLEASQEKTVLVPEENISNAAGRIKVDLSELYDLLDSKLMALESLDRTKEKFAEFLEPLVESCLPETVFRAWERSRSVEDSSPQDSARSLYKLLCFLWNEVQSEEMIKFARTGLGASRVSHPRSQPDEPDCSTAAALVNFQDNSDRESTKSNDESTVVCTKSSVLSNQSVINETVYLQTLVLKIEHNGKELKVRTILDSGSQVLYIGEGEGEINKRNVLAMVHKIFDLLGILTPTTLLPKILLQEAWNLKLKWDDPLPKNIQKTFRKWRDETQYLEKIDIPRYVEINENSKLHLFVDACKSSYGACVYVRTVTPLGVKIRLIRAKSRVAPLKTLTIPWPELMTCCIGARLFHAVFAALDLPDLKIVAWSDSMVALWWLKNHGDWSVFVANREGPSWLLEPPSNWPIDRLA
ncbi:putative RNA-directed DNA polymerase from transposon X-element [Trichonephila inaurata madagascariensis]|uniref:Putative RNA-directed DNA polymerase from transposon X-element n=1 Tax=Trichonephila inaurata madagascariensis TaxID=2747483 RepID=A0A8X6YJT3_9ARAC|nr:putative RNA-directed DNA polymerase from transposon X-element [Trichonephila inaurata madagascariensis]